ncbi:DNA-directed RNA polymerase subunit beta [candidate division BRC1 bacterium HGW-BRC1-1]|nr:MAG: DNA-directed RNA polymerase subunit beta [candidate division BRC1 bacterium HGW-BRC1-1]
MIDGRLNFAQIPSVMKMPYLLETQKKSYNEFLQMDVLPDMRERIGLQEAFLSVFPIVSANTPSTLEFVKYSFGRPKYEIKECMERGMTYAAPLKVELQLIVRDRDEITGEVEVRDIKEQETYMGDIPLMTPQGTFIINGAERVIVSQLHRSPGVSFSSGVHPNGKTTYSGRVIPYRGAWVEFEVDINNVMYVMVDRKRKLPATTFLRCFGVQDNEEIAKEFFKSTEVKLDDFKKGATLVADLNDPEKFDSFKGTVFIEDILEPKGEGAAAKKERTVLVQKGAKVTKKASDLLLKKGVVSVHLDVAEGYEHLLGRVLGADVVDTSSGEVLGDCFEKITTTLLRRFSLGRISKIELMEIDESNPDVVLSTMAKDKVKTFEEALTEFFKRMRPGNPVTIQTSRRLFEDTFSTEKRYDLGAVGRHKIDRRFKIQRPAGVKPPRTLTKADVVCVIKELARIAETDDEVDDIDHLGNRRVRSVGELLQNQIRNGLAELEKTARDRMNSVGPENLMPQNLVNSKPIVTQVKEFFSRSQLSQFMDQTNPLSELTHKRRLSALGPGGLSRDRAGFEVRDVHHTHYGRVCPIETPEGPNIGLISSLSTYAQINDFGFIESPYRRVANCVVTNDIQYMAADEEDEYIVAQANTPVDENNRITVDMVLARVLDDFPEVQPKEVRYMDVSPNQLVSVSAALIPFLEHDDANRALMGSNMQRQAVPLIFTDPPIVGTGMERRASLDSGACLLSPFDGLVERATATEVTVRSSSNEHMVDMQSLMKYRRSNQDTCMNQRTLVKEGQKVAKGDVLADGPAVRDGELALGANLLAAFMPFGGYNFEDAILISERVVTEDVLTSIHIEEHTVDARDTKLGKEDITRDIPNVNEEMLAKLDENGLIMIGSEVKHNDILVGKVTPRGETEQSPEDKLLRAIFGEKANDVRDASLKVPPGTQGVVVDVKVFSRKERGVKTEKEDKTRITEIEAKQTQERSQLDEAFNAKLVELLADIDKPIINFEDGNVELKPKQKVSQSALDYVKRSLRTGMLPVDGAVADRVKRAYQEHVQELTAVDDNARNKIDRIKTGDELPPGVIKVCKVFVATKRKLQVGDKMAGRHGNKGVVARIMPVQEMPFLADGTPVDIVLNPLGVPSRMNVGQVLETHLGWAAKALGIKMATPVFDGASEMSIKTLLLAAWRRTIEEKGIDLVDDQGKKVDLRHIPSVETLRTNTLKIADLWQKDSDRGRDSKGRRKASGSEPADYWDVWEEWLRVSEAQRLQIVNWTGQALLYDGASGEPFDRPVTVGYLYMMKLAHLVDDKMHARAIGPYSLVTQQPLGGKAQFGGQRFGEMEVWALEAYGAAYTLQELLTVKSDDVEGRTKIYQSIIKGENHLQPGIPESFNVLVKELQGLGLNLELLTEDESVSPEESDSGMEAMMSSNLDDSNPFQNADGMDDDDMM